METRPRFKEFHIEFTYLLIEPKPKVSPRVAWLDIVRSSNLPFSNAQSLLSLLHDYNVTGLTNTPQHYITRARPKLAAPILRRTAHSLRRCLRTPHHVSVHA